MPIKSKVPNDKYREEWDRIFGKKDRRDFEYPPIEMPDYDKPDTYKQDQKH